MAYKNGLVLISVAFTAMCVLSLFLCCGISDASNPDGFTTEDGLKYAIIDDDTVSLSGYTTPFDPSKGLTVPSKVSHDGKEYSVCTIGNSAFYGCSALTSLILNEGLESIGDHAFDSCKGLTSLFIPGSVKVIGDYAFCNCSGLKGTLELSDNIVSIGNMAFYKCSGLTGSLAIPKNIEIINNSAFCECSGFTELVLNDKLTMINYAAFEGCSGLKGSLSIPSGIAGIGDRAFYGCSGLTGTLSIPYGVSSIGQFAFCDCGGFDGKLIIPGTVKSIGRNAFIGCSGFNTVSIAKGVTGIDRDAFYSWGFYDKDGTKIADMKNLPGYTYSGSAEKMVRQSSFCTLSFNECGGSSKIVPIMADEGSTIELPGYAGTKSGYAFGGWSSNGKTYHAGDEYKVVSDVSFEAVWKNGSSNDNTFLIASAIAALIAIIAIAVYVVKRKP